jgi:hypothetical protein
LRDQISGFVNTQRRGNDATHKLSHALLRLGLLMDGNTKAGEVLRQIGIQTRIITSVTVDV